MSATWLAGATLPDLGVIWLDDAGQLHQFAAGWTFTIEVARSLKDAALFTKVSGITGADTSPNVLAAWDDGEIGDLTPGRYLVQVTAIRTSDSHTLKGYARLLIRPSITP